jgi:ribonuclease P protein component
VGHGFPRSARLRKRRDYLAVQSAGAVVHTRHFVLLVERDGSGRVGITVSKKIGNSVTRNRVKRLVREAVRQWGDAGECWVPAGRDVVVVAKRSSASATFAEVARDLARHREKVVAC